MWHLQSAADRAALNTAVFSCGVTLSRPAAGLESIQVQGASLADAGLFRIALTPPSDNETVQESYLRGNDLVILYQQFSARTVRPQIYWRELPEMPANAGGIELVLSVQTDLLQSHPQARVSSQLSAAHVMYCQPDARWQKVEQTTTLHGDVARPLIVVRGPHWSYVEMAYPGDFQTARVESNGQRFRSEWELFAEHLEKGVIRRARLRGVFIPSQHDLETAAGLYAQFLESPLPLTT